MLTLSGFLFPNRLPVGGPKIEVPVGAGASSFFYSLGFAAGCGIKPPPALFSVFFGIVLAKRLLPIDPLDFSKIEVV